MDKRMARLGVMIVLIVALGSACGQNSKNEDNNGWDVSDPLDDAGGSDATSPPVGAPGVMVLVDAQEVQLREGVSDVVDFVVPQGSVAVTITVAGASLSEMYALDSWTGPEGTVLVQENWVEDEPNRFAAFGLPTTICHTICDNRIAASEAAFATIAPNNPAATVLPGAHQIKVYGVRPTQTAMSPSNSRVKVTIHAKVMDAEPQTGVLDLNIHFTGSNGWSAATAPNDPAFQAVIDGVNQIYSQVGIELGEIAYHDVDPQFQVIESLQGAGSDMMQLLSTVSEGALNGANLFFVEEIKSPVGTILGIAGGIPGPVLVPGTGRSGVVVGTTTIQGGPTLAHVVAHELGHYMGLFHTTENLGGLAGPAHDPLPDTPEGDESYLMHASGAGGTLSPWQGKVMRLNPWVRQMEVE